MIHLLIAWQLVAISCVGFFAREHKTEESNLRYALMEFEGFTELPRGSQFSVVSNTESVLPSETVKKPVRLVVVADVQTNEIWLFARMSPWRLDVGTIDVEREYLWHQTDEGVSLVYEQTQTRWNNSMWSMDFRSIFSDLIAMPDEGEIARVVDCIKSACNDGLLNSTAESIISGDALLERIWSLDGKSLVVNQFRAGEAMSAVRAVVRENAVKCYDVVSTLFAREKPVAIRTGTLQLKYATSLPEEIQHALVHVDKEPRLSTVSKNRPTSDFVRNASLTVFWIASAAFLCVVLCCQFVFGGNKNGVSS